MKKTVSAFVVAASILCAASPLYAKTPAHATAKHAATRVHVAYKKVAGKKASVQKVADKATPEQSSVEQSVPVQKISEKVAVKASPARVTRVSSRSSTSPYLQCVTFVRQFTGMQIFGDAWTWWEKATGKYAEGARPKPGSVLVFRPQGKMKLGHVAVVSQIITERYIQVTHANWSPINGRRGQVEDHVNVMDVSDKGDWSKVKVWYGPLNDFGTTVYTTYGFIYQDTPQGQAAAQQLIDNDQKTIQAPTQQIAMAAPMPAAPEVPADLKAALAASNTQGFLGVKATTVSAQVTGKAAKDIVAKIDSDNAKPVVAPVAHAVAATVHP